jgi:hypothetical protein
MRETRCVKLLGKSQREGSQVGKGGLPPRSTKPIPKLKSERGQATLPNL